MTTAVISNYLENEILKFVLRNTAFASPGTSVYIALYTDATAQDDANAGTEVSLSGTAYARKQVQGTGAWDAPSSGATANTSELAWTTATANWGNVRYIGIIDTASGAGNLLFWGQLTADKQVDSGDTFSIAAGDLDVSLGGAFSHYLAGALLNHILRATAYTRPTDVKCALFTTTPGADGTGGTEVTGGSYARISIYDTADWDVPSGGATQNTNIEAFATATANWGVVAGMALYDQTTNMLFFGNLTASKTVNNGDTFRFSAGALDIAVS